MQTAGEALVPRRIASGIQLMRPGLARMGAFAIDYLVLAIYAAILSVVITAFFSGNLAIPDTPATKMRGHLIAFLTLTLPVWLYFTALEGGSHNATIGKRILGLQVRDARGEGASFRSAAIRNAVRFLPWEIAHAAIWYGPGRPFLDPMSNANLAVCVAACLVAICYIVSLFLPGGRTPYDRLAGTGVLLKKG